jgi:predicted HicB family RNase H-like nuclease
MSQSLRYKNYYGSVQVSDEDAVLHGKIIGIRDSVTYEGASVPELKQHFREAVDEYLAFCAAEGKEPDVPYKGTFNVRLGQELHASAAIFAQEKGWTLNRVVSEAVAQLVRTG